MNITVTYPPVILMDGNLPILVNLVDGSAQARAFVVFTDRAAAEQYRDENCPQSKVALIPNEEAFSGALTVIQEIASWGALDPYPLGTRPLTIPIIEMLQQLPLPADA